MKKYFGMKKVSVRKETKSELSEQTAERRENKALYVVSCIVVCCFVHIYNCEICSEHFLRGGNNGVLSEKIRAFFC